MSKHTGKRWEVGEQSESHSAIIDQDGKHVAEVRNAWGIQLPNDPEQYGDDNAHLIAAAPELLEALERVEKRLTACANAFYVDGNRMALLAAFDGWKDDINPARDAIAKFTCE